MAIGRSGFTIVDVLALSAVTVTAGAVMQPLLEETDEKSMALTNRAQHQRLSASQGMFIAANDGQFTSANVTGWLSTPGSNQDPSLFEGNQTSSTPTQTTDWITPLLGDELGLSPNRAIRTQQLLEQVRDPRNGIFNDTLFMSGADGDGDDFVNAFNNGGYRAVSYLAPAAFQYWGTPEPGGFVKGKGIIPGDEEIWQQMYGGVPYNFGGSIAFNIETPREYRPRIENVGPSLSEKVMFADGTRYVEFSGVVDIESTATPGVFGNFVSGFFASEFETAYGRDRPGIFASARRQGLGNSVDNRVLYISFYDGSTRTSTVTNAKARPDWWAPTGSEWQSLDNVAPEAASQYDVGDLLP
ncbi:MAG: hypothetical protein Phyf2KO_16830 [Phycisphaerales bacterium]